MARLVSQHSLNEQSAARYTLLRLSYFNRRNKPVELLIGAPLAWLIVSLLGGSTIGFLIRLFH